MDCALIVTSDRGRGADLQCAVIVAATTAAAAFILLQPSGVLLPEKRQEQRPKFHADKWAKAHQLGDPVAAAYFQTAAGE